jgi:GrpB-like predicted nucleotidyltransferase (UPF0157 family)
LKVEIAEPDPGWPAAFEAAHREFARIPGAACVEHIGSTSVPGLAAKPILDFLIGVEDEALLDTSGEEPWSTASTYALAPGGPAAHVAFVEAVSRVGYVYRGNGGFEHHLFFRRDTNGQRSHHVHVAPIGGAYWADHLLFRDYLRAHPERAAAYGALKRRLAVEFPESRAYTEAKTPFVEGVLADARHARVSRIRPTL